MGKNVLLAGLSALAVASGLAFATPAALEVNALGEPTRTTGAVASGSDRELYFYYQPAALDLAQEGLTTFPWASTTVTDLALTGITGPAGFTPTLDSAVIMDDANGQPVLQLGVDIADASGTATGEYDLSIQAKNTRTGETFSLPVTVWVQ